MPRIRDVRQDIQRRLLETGAFSAVYLTGLPEDRGRSASDVNAAAIELAAERSAPRYGGGAGTTVDNFDRIPVTLMARDPDAETRDANAELLLQYLKNAVNGQSLAGITVPDHTYVESSTPERERHPERRIRAIVLVEYLADGWDNYDTNP